MWHTYCSFSLWLSFSTNFKSSWWLILHTHVYRINLMLVDYIKSPSNWSVMYCWPYLVQRGWSVCLDEAFFCQKLETYWIILMQFDIQYLSVMFDFFSFVNKTKEDCMLGFFFCYTHAHSLYDKPVLNSAILLFCIKSREIKSQTRNMYPYFIIVLNSYKKIARFKICEGCFGYKLLTFN